MLTAASASSSYYCDPRSQRFSRAEPLIEPNAWSGVTAVVFLGAALWFNLFKGKGGTDPKESPGRRTGDLGPKRRRCSLAKVLRDVEAGCGLWNCPCPWRV